MIETTPFNSEKKEINFLKEMSDFKAVSTYARYNKAEGRRETWEEGPTRIEDMMLRKYNAILNEEQASKVKWAFDLVRKKRVAPSMRNFQFAGKAVETNNLRAYNCAVRHIDSLRSFSEVFFALLSGSGVTIGLNAKFFGRIPDLAEAKDKTGTVTTYVIEDTIEGWADSIEALLMCYHKGTAYTGRKLVFDYSKIRAKGTELKTTGGKAPGHTGLKAAHEKIKKWLDHLIEDNKQKRLRTTDAMDICMHMSDAVLSGGIRRAAMAVIFQEDDEAMFSAKTLLPIDKYRSFSKEGDIYEGFVWLEGLRYEVALSEYDYDLMKRDRKISWFHVYPWRSRSNNSVIIDKNKTSKAVFDKVFDNVKEFGEPGFFFTEDQDALSNPCFEIGFIPVTDSGECGLQVCNLTSINGAKISSIEDWKDAVEAATIIGTLQAGFTDFPYLNKASKILTEEEALLGVSITGFMDTPDILLDERNQYMMAKLAVKVNEDWSKIIGINQAARITTTKPEGTFSIIAMSASGIHPHHAHQYFRRMQVNKEDVIYKHFQKYNPHATEESVHSANKTDDIITFPIDIPKMAMVKKDLTAIEHLNIIRKTYENWILPGTSPANKKKVTHNISATVIVKDDEWDLVKDYLYENRLYFGGVSLLSSVGDKIYKQAPMEEVVTEEDIIKFNLLKDKWVEVDYTTLKEYEDTTKVSDTVACGGGSCEI